MGREIEALYKLTENNALCSKWTTLVLPIVEQTHDSINMIEDTFMDYMEANEIVTPTQKRKIESAIRGIFTHLIDFVPNARQVILAEVKN